MRTFKPKTKRAYSAKEKKIREDLWLDSLMQVSGGIRTDLYPPEAGQWEASEIEMQFYEKFFFSKDLEPYPVQEEAFNRIFANENVLVTVPTGTGKTMIAKAGLYKALYSNQTAIYTTPLRALTEEKYRELCEDFGEKYVGFATGDYKVNSHAPIQVVVAEILWNRIFSNQLSRPADIVIMDEGHYFNEPQRGYVWEQSIIGMHPVTQLVVLSATVGNPREFCQWAYVVRRVPMALVESHVRRIPLQHIYEEKYLLEMVRELYKSGDYPVIIFTFGRQLCFERARLLKSCARFTTKEEQKEIEALAAPVLIPRGLGESLLSLLTHGIGIHHAGILPAYKHLVEQLTLKRLLKFVISTETIAAGINLPAKRVLFPDLRKYIKRKARILVPAEYHQMAGRAGRPQFDKEGIAITLAPEDVVQEFRKEIREAERSRRNYDENQIKKRAYSRARSEAQRRNDVVWDDEIHKQLAEGKSANLKSQTKITAEQILAIGLPDLTRETLPAAHLVQQELERKAAKAAERAQAEAEAAAQGALTGTESPPNENADASEQNNAPTSEEEKRANREKKRKEFSKPLTNKGFSGLGQLMAQMQKKDEAQEEKPPQETPKKEPAPTTPLNATTSTKAEETAVSLPNTQFLLPVGAPPKEEKSPQERLPAYMNLNIRTIIDNLLLPEKEKRDAQKLLVKITNNLRALGVLDEKGIQVKGKLIGELRGIDGPFIYHCLMTHDFVYEQSRELVEFLVDHNVIQRILDRKLDEERREWIRQRLRERRASEPQVSWEDVEEEYKRKFPKPLSFVEQLHKKFVSQIPHPELHGGKRHKNVWAQIDEKDATFMEFVEEHKLEREEGSLFSYLARVMKVARMLHEVTQISDFWLIERKIRHKLAVLDVRILNQF